MRSKISGISGTDEALSSGMNLFQKSFLTELKNSLVIILKNHERNFALSFRQPKFSRAFNNDSCRTSSASSAERLAHNALQYFKASLYSGLSNSRNWVVSGNIIMLKH